MSGFPNVTDCSCSGHGSCVTYLDSTLCLCTGLWDGGNDFFDNRIVYSTLHNAWLSLKCSNSVLGVTIAWSLLIVFSFRRMLAMVYTFYATVQYEKRAKGADAYIRKMTWSRLYNFLPYRFLLLGITIETPIVLAAVVSKVSLLWAVPSGPQGVLGTEISSTVLVMLGGLVRLCFFTWLEIVRFQTLLKGQNMTRESRNRIVMQFRICHMFALICYTFAGLVPSVYMLSLDKTHGPLASGSQNIIISRNIGVLTGIIAGTGGLVILGLLIQRLIGDMSNPDSARTASNRQETVVDLLQEIEKTRKKSIVTGLFAILMYTCFSLPFAWEYQTYCIVLVLVLGDYTMNPLMVFKAPKHSAMKGTTGTVLDETLASAPTQQHIIVSVAQ